MARRLYLLAAVFAGLFVAAFAVDLPVSDFCREGRVPGDLRKLFELAEVFAHGIGVGCIMLTVLVLDRSRRRWVPRVLACAYGAGLVADLAKLMIARMRPRTGEYTSVWDTFVGWCPWLMAPDLHQAFDSDFQSLPSAHTATAVGLAIGLATMYPQGRWLFAFFALIASLQRVVASAHFVSDTFAGAAIGCLVAAVCLDSRIAGKWFDRIEAAHGAGPENRCDFRAGPIG